jgi:hypothetical protein
LLAVLSLSALSSAAAQTERRSIGGRTVALYNVAGVVRVERGRSRDVEFEITRRGRDGGKLRIETGSVRGLPTLRVIYPDDDVVYRGDVDADRDDRSGRSDRDRNRNWGSRWGSRTESSMNDDGTWGGDRGWGVGRRRVRVSRTGSGLEAWADIRVLVPEGQELKAYLLVGELRADDVNGDLTLDVASARVFTNRTRGVLNIDAGSGGVEVRDARGGRVSVDNGSGGVLLEGIDSDDCSVDTGSGGVTGTGVGCRRFNLDVGSGGVRLLESTMSEVSIDAGSGGIELDLRSSPRSLSIESGSGSVTLRVPDGYSASVDIETGSGSISTDFAVRTSRVERNALRGTIGDGRGRLRVETGSGSVRLRRG